VFAFRRAGSSGIEFYKVNLTDVTVATITQVAGTGLQYPLSFNALDAGADRTGFLDAITLDYRKIAWDYTPAGPGGGPLASVKGGWDITTNQKV
jgi:type VI protein secretion system component Hcp